MGISGKTHAVFLSFAAPFIWIASSSQIATSNSCYPCDHPLLAPLWHGLREALAIITFICLITGFVCVVAAGKNLREIQKKIIHHEESRTHFMAVLSVMSTLLSFLAIVFTGCANLLVGPCSQ